MPGVSVDSKVAQLPFCVEGKIISRQYVFGIFVHQGVSEAQHAYNTVKGELLREPIRAAL
jgi:hypothetical protein